MATDKETLKTFIAEHRRFHDELTQSYHADSTRIITYIGGIFPLLLGAIIMIVLRYFQ